MWQGRTPGKRLFGLRVIKDGGYPLDWTGSSVRNLLRIVDFGLFLFPGFALMLCGAPGLVSIFLSPQYKRIGDYAAGTLVIVESGNSPFSNRSAAPPTPAVLSMLPYVRNLTRLTPAEYRVVRRFTSRRADLELTVQGRARRTDCAAFNGKIRNRSAYRTPTAICRPPRSHGARVRRRARRPVSKRPNGAVLKNRSILHFRRDLLRHCSRRDYGADLRGILYHRASRFVRHRFADAAGHWLGNRRDMVGWADSRNRPCVCRAVWQAPKAFACGFAASHSHFAADYGRLRRACGRCRNLDCAPSRKVAAFGFNGARSGGFDAQ